MKRRRLIVALAMLLALVGMGIWTWPKVHFLTTKHITHEHADGTVSTWCVVEPRVWPGLYVRIRRGGQQSSRSPIAGARLHPPRPGRCTRTASGSGSLGARCTREDVPCPMGRGSVATESVEIKIARQGHLPR